ncbi:hypothetical protein GCM10023334_077190 [Nonomuraea thailandensis]
MPFSGYFTIRPGLPTTPTPGASASTPTTGCRPCSSRTTTAASRTVRARAGSRRPQRGPAPPYAPGRRWDGQVDFTGTYGEYLLSKVSKVFPHLSEQQQL